MYGNNYEANPEQTRIFPFILSKIIPNDFAVHKCTFGDGESREKEATARVTMWRFLNIPAVYTLESSLCGGLATQNSPHFTPEDLALQGKSLCLALLIY